MFVFVKKVDGQWKIAVATIEEVENHQVDWSSDEFSRTTFWTKNAGEALIVAARMYHALKEDGVIGIIPLEGIGE